MIKGKVDLNLLIYLDALLRERSVTRAADHLGISQPALSNGLKRLRALFDDPLLVRTSDGMTPTERAIGLAPMVRELLLTVDKVVEPQAQFQPALSSRVFRIVASDYAESTLMPPLLARLRDEAPGVALDIMTPSDVSFPEVEQAHVDLVINRFDELPQSFHQKDIWQDDFSCLLNADHPVLKRFTLETYLDAHHVWVSKTGMGAGVGVNPDDVQRLGWVDEALAKIGKQRQITLFTRHYQAAMLLAERSDLIATLPSRAARSLAHNPNVVIRRPPFEIPPITLKMAWSPLLHAYPAHRWIRRLIADVAAGASQLQNVTATA